MSPALQVALAVGPLAAYFATLGALQAGRRPVVIPGSTDFALLAAGLAGPVVFGPVGQVLVVRLFPQPNLWAWLALLSSYALLALLAAPRLPRRLVVYNVDPDALVEAARDALPAGFAPTLRGYEDRERGLALFIEPGRLRAGSIEVLGDEAPGVLAALAPTLRDRLARGEPARSPVSAGLWFTLAALVLLVPYAGLLARPRVFDALRALLGGG